MTRSRSVIVAFALVMSLLAVTAMPVSASHGPVVVSNHTTDSDFNAGTLTNTTVFGTGDAATVEGNQTVTVTFDYTGSEQTWTVPEGVDSVHVELHGAGTSSANGGYVEGDLDVTPGETLRLYVGQGRSGQSSGGWNGGGDGDTGTNANAEGGAGATDIRQGGSALSDRVVVAGGAGGSGDTFVNSGDCTVNGQGGAGGDDTGEDAEDIACGGHSTDGGHGGTQSAGGAGGSGDASGDDGSLGQGGNGAGATSNDDEARGGGGGGGYYGGGGGSAEANIAAELGAGGGGGSNYKDGLSSADSNQRGAGNSGNGQIVIEYQAVQTSGTYISQNHTVEGSVGGEVNFTTLDNGTATVTWEGWDGNSWTQLSQTTGITSSGVYSDSWSEFTTTDTVRVNVTVVNDTGSDPATFEVASEGVKADTSAPTIDNSSATPTGDLDSATPTLEIDVNDSDFAKAHGDSVEVEFFADGSSIGTDTLTSNGTASVTVSNALTGGDHTWNATATDDYGHSTTSQDFAISTPGEITIRNETSPYGLVTGANATLRFFEDEEDDPTIVERTDDDDDGNISLSGLPVDGEFVVSIKADGYNNRTITIEDIFEQETVFLLSTDRPTIENRFTVEDRTGDFPPEETQLIIQKPINQSEYDSSADGFEWMNVAGDDLGADEAFVTDLEEGDRYRIKVQNDDGDQRILGAYTAETAGTINLVIGRVTLDPTATGQPAYDAERTNESGSPVKVTFEYNDSEDSTTQIWLHIYEYNNQSNELLANTSFTPSSGNFGLFTNTENVPDAENGTTWVVDFTAERDGEDNVNGRMIVGPRDDILSDMPAWLLSIIYVGSLLIVAGLFSQLNAEVGALVVAALGAIFFFAGFAPAGVGSGVVVLALMVAGALFIQGQRSGI